ncbi:probable splicing factor, arginine/serine-rich 5 [Ornithodoros turicata]|uniref:probable splicing factor, arginine/serine-rich 5 n=1 Tax=Ornithodoros turicata TaxID=34597 RepID=UPI0031398D8F
MSSRAQLFIGRLPLDTRERDVEQVFERYGRLLRCDVKYGTGMAYAFVDYDDHRDAEDAIKYENGRDIRGQSIVVEWARGPSYRPSGGGKQNYFDECYRCRRTGHWARDCPDSDRHYGGSSRRSRSPRRNRRPPPRSRYSRSASRSRSKSRSRSPRRSRRSWTRSRSRSHTPDRRRSRTRSPSPDRQRRAPTENGDRSRSGSPRAGSAGSGRRGSRSKSR